MDQIIGFFQEQIGLLKSEFIPFIINNPIQFAIFLIGGFGGLFLTLSYIDYVEKDKVKNNDKDNNQDFIEEISEVPLPIMFSASDSNEKDINENKNVEKRKIQILKNKPSSYEDQAQASNVNYTSKKNILIVDDSKLVLFDLTKNVFNNDEFEVVTAENAFDALAYLSESKKLQLSFPSIVLSDIEMPLNDKGEGDGFYLLKEIKKIYGDELPVILMTNNLEILEDRGSEEGASGFLSKPLEKDILLSQINFCLNNE